MHSTPFKKGFSSRLNDALIANGKFSSRSSAGVSIKALAEAAGCSLTMARKYVVGDSLPDIESLTKISEWLNVSPEWLIVRECLTMGLKDFRSQELITASEKINTDILQKRIAVNTIYIYCLLEEFIKQTVKNGEQLSNTVETNAEQMVISMLKKSEK